MFGCGSVVSIYNRSNILSRPKVDVELELAAKEDKDESREKTYINSYWEIIGDIKL